MNNTVNSIYCCPLLLSFTYTDYKCFILNHVRAKTKTQKRKASQMSPSHKREVPKINRTGGVKPIRIAEIPKKREEPTTSTKTTAEMKVDTTIGWAQINTTRITQDQERKEAWARSLVANATQGLRITSMTIVEPMIPHLEIRGISTLLSPT